MKYESSNEYIFQQSNQDAYLTELVLPENIVCARGMMFTQTQSFRIRTHSLIKVHFLHQSFGSAAM